MKQTRFAPSIQRTMVLAVAACAVIGTMIFVANRTDGSDRDRLQSLIQNNKATLDSIKTFSAIRVERSTQSGRTGTPSETRYWRNGDRIRMQQFRGADLIADNCLIGTEGKSLDPIRKANSNVIVEYGASRFARSGLRGDVWRTMWVHFSWPRVGGGSIPLEEFITFAKSSPSVSEVTDKGEKCVRLEVEYDDLNAHGILPVRLTAWFNKNRSYLAQRVKFDYGPEFAGTKEFAVTEFFEYEPGHYFPVKSESSASEQGNVYYTNSTELKDVRINQPIDDAVFQLPRPPNGTILLDLNQNKTYPINERWEPIGEAKPHQVMTFPITAAKDDEFNTSQSTSQRIRRNWLLIASVAIVAIGLTGIGVRWIRNRRTSASSRDA